MRNLEREKENVETNFYLVFLQQLVFLRVGTSISLDFIGFNIDNSDNFLVINWDMLWRSFSLFVLGLNFDEKVSMEKDELNQEINNKQQIYIENIEPMNRKVVGLKTEIKNRQRKLKN